jgi:hypothetical protein
MYASLLGNSGALYLSVFEQPESRVFFSNLLVYSRMSTSLFIFSLGAESLKPICMPFTALGFRSVEQKVKGREGVVV